MTSTTFKYSNETFFVKYDPSDNSGLGAITEIVNRNEYVLDKFTGQQNKVFIDIGANIGIATIIMAKLNPQSIVYSFEPFEKAYTLLLKNIIANKLTNVKPFNLAVSNKANKKLTLSIFNTMSGANSTYSDPDKFSSFWKTAEVIKEVDCIYFDKILVDNKIKEIYLLKIDCEGAEFDIIYDSDFFKNKIVKNMVGEFHDLKYNTINDSNQVNLAKSASLITYCKNYVDGIFKVSILQI